MLILENSSPLWPNRLPSALKLRHSLLKTNDLVSTLISDTLKRNLVWDIKEFRALEDQEYSMVLSFLQRE